MFFNVFFIFVKIFIKQNKMAKATAMQVYKFLPGTNCRECGEESCMAFAIKLVAREVSISRCRTIDPKKKAELIERLTPKVREVNFGKIAVGGEEVMYRHELKFYNQTGLFIDISDSVSNEEILRRIDFVKNLRVERIGKILTLDGIALRCESNNVDKFKNLLEIVKKNYDGNLILCSFNPQVISEVIEIVKDFKPLIYAAKKENFDELFSIAKKYDIPLVIYGSFDDIGEMAGKAISEKFYKILIEPGFNNNLKETLNRLTELRRAAVSDVKELGFPVITSTIPAWTNEVIASSYYESILLSILIDRFASIIIFHSTEIWSLMPVLYLRLNIYSDPKVSPTIEPKVYAIGTPDEYSPVLVTTNFALTYFAVTGDLNASKSSAWLLVVDTEGLAVLVSVAAGKFNASKIKEALEKEKISEKVKHTTLVLPGVASAIAGLVEDETKWSVMVGPKDSADLGVFIEKKWMPYVKGIKEASK